MNDPTKQTIFQDMTLRDFLRKVFSDAEFMEPDICEIPVLDALKATNPRVVQAIEAGNYEHVRIRDIQSLRPASVQSGIAHYYFSLGYTLHSTHSDGFSFVTTYNNLMGNGYLTVVGGLEDAQTINIFVL